MKLCDHLLESCEKTCDEPGSRRRLLIFPYAQKLNFEIKETFGRFGNGTRPPAQHRKNEKGATGNVPDAANHVPIPEYANLWVISSAVEWRKFVENVNSMSL